MSLRRKAFLWANQSMIAAPTGARPKYKLPTPDRDLQRLIDEMLAARYRAGLTQQQIAVRLNTTRSAISRLESGKFHRPNLATLEKYA